MIRSLFTLALMISSVACSAATEAQPEAAGTVTWLRSLDTALAASAKTQKPVFALFQEIPGCAGCRQFGRDVLSNPLIVDAIENEFTPLLIHNNKSGYDAEVLGKFGEPAWNYQVVRFLDAQSHDLIPRKEQVWETGPLATRMIHALTKAKRTVPAYLTVLAAGHSSGLHEAVFAMYCFWTGEMELGQINGVVTTEAGFLDGSEVTRVRYDPALISLPQLIAAAERVKCANAVFVPATELEDAKASRLRVGVIANYRTAPTDDQKKQLTGTAAAKLKLTGAQATKVNAWIRSDTKKALSFLSPSQVASLR